MSPRASRIAVVTVVTVAALVRLAATWNDLWLDEVWTLTLIGTLHSPLGVLTELRHDNNHVLNTLLCYVLRPLGSDWVFRVPAWLAGIATIVIGVALAGLDDEAAPRTSRIADAPREVRRLVTALVLGVSYSLVHYGSEARGYALAIAFGLAAVLVAFRDRVSPWSRRAPLAWAALVLAFLSHALALHVIVALGVWASVHALRRDGLPRGIVTVAWWFAVPVLAFAVFYAGFLRGITVGGGTREGIVPPLLNAIAVTTGLPFGASPILLVVTATALIAASLVWLVRRGSDEWVFYLVGIVGSPFLLAVIQPTNLYAERYFLVSATLLLLLAARVAAWALTRGGAARVIAAVALGAFVVGNTRQVARLLVDGRGAYQEAIQYMLRHTPDPVLTVKSDHDFRNRLLVEYYAPRFAATKTIRYVRATDTDVPSPLWYIAHRFAGDSQPPAVIMDRGGNRYSLVAQYPTAPLSGFRWFIFQRVAAAP